MGKSFIIPFPGPEQASRDVVGGKGASLLRMAAAGLPVPPGTILTTGFFAPWFDVITETDAWLELMETGPDAGSPLFDALKARCRALPLTADQQCALERLREDLAARCGEGARFAVRSSSPEEDLESASFAGGYETRLGVPLFDLEDAVRHCCASSLDQRVFVYKSEHGLDDPTPRLAVVVQEQIDSDVAGVGFSLNPVTNDYDEAVIDANWGLGTTVVEGRVAPDHFVVNKVDRQVVEETQGDKPISVWLDADAGTIERDNAHPAERTLTDAQLQELTNLIGRIEALYDKPVDIEWAYADGELYVLQARPITRYVPLPPEMVTRPGQRRRLYADAALSKGLTTNAPISSLGLDNMKSLFSAIIERSVGFSGLDAPPEEALFFFTGGRMYVNYSNMMWLASPAMLAKNTAPTDALMAEILANVDEERYRTAPRPSWVSGRLLCLILRIVWNFRSFFGNLVRTLLAPEGARQAYRRTTEAIESELRDQIDGGLSLNDFRHTYEPRIAHELFNVLMPVLLVGMLPPTMAVLGKSDEEKALADQLTRGATDNVVVEMGIALYRLAQLLGPSDFDDLDRLAERVERREVPAEFLDAWDEFLAQFGWRGPQETDLASPRYGDDPRLALRQMSYMAVGDGEFDPEAAHRRQVEKRQQAYEALMQRLGPLRQAPLRWIYQRIDRFAGTRDTPKHLLVLFNYVIRKRALAEGRRLVQEGRLDTPEDVFDLKFDDLEAAAQNPTLRALREEQARFREKLEAHVTKFPPIIDSRGRILRPPPREDGPGLLRGMAVSPGIATGPIKILHAADEKRVEKGDVLVAYTTDPGWTPLFVNAAAIVLEVGGVLQHGAVVAREYGKPCVVGIDRVTERLQDGQQVEVDGTTGTVRLLSHSCRLQRRNR